MLLTLLTLSLLNDVAPRPRPRPAPPPPQAAECRADGDCVLSTFQGCCGNCCAVAPHAVVRGSNEGAQCAVIDCEAPDCSRVRCRSAPPPGAFVPACRAGRCVAVPRDEPPAQCRIDADCRVVSAAPPTGAACHQSACGCCATTQAIPADAVVPLQQRPRPGGKPQTPGSPPFGLSTGKPDAPAPNCSPCPAPEPGVAACQAGRCVLQSTPRPRPWPMPRG